MVDSKICASVKFYKFELSCLEIYLELKDPLFYSPERAFCQLRYVERYADDLGCKSIAIEQHYIDRDYIEDHSVFYSKSLYAYTNYCRRVHFFKIDVETIKTRFETLITLGADKGELEYREACKNFSESEYLGFSVIKPLDGSPVGRTVLKCFSKIPSNPEDKSERNFGCTKNYHAHLLGVELTIRGLAFQQQDVGVSACATTAVWSALQKIRDHEEIGAFTPAQITALASKYSLPFGRSMPSEGLSIDQMCQAIQALGASPNIVRIQTLDHAKSYLYTSVYSELAPILILTSQKGAHAVAVAGMKLRSPRQVTPQDDGIDHYSNDLIALYVHDDRKGPYLRANLLSSGNKCKIHIPARDDLFGSDESWDLSHILIPTHSKVRVSIAGLEQAALQTIPKVKGLLEALEKLLTEKSTFFQDKTVSYRTYLSRSHQYVESIFMNDRAISANFIAALTTKIPMSRYLGIIRIVSPVFDEIDLLIDTTSTQRNIHSLGVIVRKTDKPLTQVLAKYLARICNCVVVINLD